MGEQSGFMNIKEVSTYLGIKVSTIYAMVAGKKIPHYRVGRLIRFKRSDVNQWMEGQKEQVVDAKAEAKRIVRAVQKRAARDVDGIVKKAIDEVNGKGYTSVYGKPDQVRGLRKEVSNESL
jgi:excisionase family DNA binding protein